MKYEPSPGGVIASSRASHMSGNLLDMAMVCCSTVNIRLFRRLRHHDALLYRTSHGRFALASPGNMLMQQSILYMFGGRSVITAIDIGTTLRDITPQLQTRCYSRLSTRGQETMWHPKIERLETINTRTPGRAPVHINAYQSE